MTIRRSGTRRSCRRAHPSPRPSPLTPTLTLTPYPHPHPNPHLLTPALAPYPILTPTLPPTPSRTPGPHQVRLDEASAAQQLAALARDFFDSFTCTAAGCTRPDPMDQGRPYRSVLGVPGGMDGPLFGVLAAANTRGMALTRGHDDEGEAANTVLAHGSNPTPAPAPPHPCPCPCPYP